MNNLIRIFVIKSCRKNIVSSIDYLMYDMGLGFNLCMYVNIKKIVMLFELKIYSGFLCHFGCGKVHFSTNL